jgi:Zn-finger nucleic acid-binding protein
MRLLLVCNHCQRQYDASAKAIGSRFHCHCGNVVDVVEPQGHDAKVVRCSSCGAGREQGASACGFCHADFTLHERDLHTTCPGCLARISDRAKYCHHCGLNIVPEDTAGDPTQLGCPDCGADVHLSSRRLGKAKLTLMECDRCAGVWLGNATFEELTRQASSRSISADEFVRASTPHTDDAGRDRESWKYRNCPSCNNLMQRRNYARRSGVITDICREHGVWFDANELPRILAWIRSGGLAQAQQQQAEQNRAEELTREIRSIGDSPRRVGTFGRLGDVGTAGTPMDGFDVVTVVLSSLFDF